MKMPDYQNCITNIIASVESHHGLNPLQETHAALDSLLANGRYRNIVLMLFDGLGQATLQEALPDNAFLRRMPDWGLSSVFPPTTTAAITSLKSGLNPVQHGWIGWTMYLPELDESIDLFTNRRQAEAAPASIAEAGMTMLPYETVFDRLQRAGISAHEVSRHGDVLTDSRQEMYDKLVELSQKPGEHFLFGYDGAPDHLMHDLGVHHPEVMQVVQEIDQELETLSMRLGEDTLLLVTADHGLVDAKYQFISDYPDIADCLVRPFVVEGRTSAFFIKPGMKEQFQASFMKCLGDHFDLLTSEDFVSKGFLGPGERHAKLMPMLGDFVTLAKDQSCLCMRPELAHLVGVHAGWTQTEMDVPLILAKS